MVGVRPLGSFSLVRRAALERVEDPDLPQHEDLLLDEDIALRLRAQVSVSGVDPTRLQRATQGAGESTGSGRDDVIERSGVLGILPGAVP